MAKDETVFLRFLRRYFNHPDPPSIDELSLEDVTTEMFSTFLTFREVQRYFEQKKDMSSASVLLKMVGEQAGYVLREYAERGRVKWEDAPLPEDDAINEAFPTRSNRHDLYQEAMRLVGARHSKGGLVALVNWLLHEREVAKNNTKKE